MPHCSESLEYRRTTRCAVCDRRFGHIRYYSWRTPLCSRKCIDRLRVRQASDRNWLPWLQATLQQVPKNGARIS
jgi:hypothetical protein